MKKKKKIKITASLRKDTSDVSESIEPFFLEKKFGSINNFKNKEISNFLLLDKKFLKKDSPKHETNPPKTHLKQINNNLVNIFNFHNETKQNLEIKNISKNLGGRPILKNISLKIPAGKISGLIGPNGSGKTTLFSTIIGKIYPDSGKIIFNNEEIQNLPIHERSLKGISLLEQTKGLFSNMTVEDNLYSILELHIKNKYEILKKIDKLLMYFNLDYLRNIKASKLSGGETKKIAILQRICNPVVNTLLLDEPCAALDPLSIATLKNFILELNQIGLTILVVEHNYWAIQDLCSNIFLIKDGEILVEGSPSKISNDENAIKYYLGNNFRI